MKSIILKMFVMLTVLILLFSLNTRVYAWSDIIDGGQNFIKAAESGHADIKKDELQDLSGFLYNTLLTAGVIIAVIVATVLGIHFIVGGAEGQAKVKEMLIPFIVGCVIVFGGFGLWKIAVDIGKRVENAPSVSAVSYESHIA